jgi:transposase
MDEIKLYIGLDVHKDSIAIASARAYSRDDPQFIGTTGYSVISLTKALAKLGKPSELSVCYEAGPCGYGLVRALRKHGYHCEVVAPSRVARRPADRIKTDRRDALLLARLHRAGELVPIVVPEPQDEAIRDLVRAREDAVNDQRRVRQRLKSFLLRHGHSQRQLPSLTGQDNLYERPRCARFSCVLIRQDGLQLYMRPLAASYAAGPDEIR